MVQIKTKWQADSHTTLWLLCGNSNLTQKFTYLNVHIFKFYKIKCNSVKIKLGTICKAMLPLPTAFLESTFFGIGFFV